ncbi:MAG: hypothetical protein [Podoviridae sp. ctKoA10]|nr:MAG: hypothetical protein [Podoviridae sp. ctKoA10]
MNEKFTPAPWKVCGDWQILDSNERLIAQFEPLNDELSNSNTPESFANAALIAAAPEMYEMLKVAIGMFSGTEFSKRAEQLLAEARGEV